MKTCFKCSRQLPLSEFYAHRQMADGHLNKCKDCARADAVKHAEILAADPDRWELELERHRIKSRKYREEGRKKPIPKAVKRAVARRHLQKYPERHFARRALAAAVKSGLLKRQPCEVCGNADSEAHHDDYSKPLDVMWLCPKHHAERHVEMRRKARLKQIC
jgi:hypothetical protein